MGVIYLISAITLLVAFILIKKSEKEIDIISFICISLSSLFCYNAIICYILTFFTIPIKLWLLSLINIIIALLFIINIINKKQIQKYILKKCDIIYICFIAIIVLVIAYINFGVPFNVKYETSDPAVHYLTSMMFAENDSLMPNAKNDILYGSLSDRQILSYVNSGILIECLCKNLEPILCYNIFVVFGIFILFLTGTTLYSTFTNFAKNNEQRVFAFIVALIAMLGYPLNSFLFGFEYLSMGLLIICTLLNLINYYEENKLNKKCLYVLLFLLNFGLFSSYYLFVPVIYLTQGIYFATRKYQETHKIISKECILEWVVTLVIPFALGFVYYFKSEYYAIFINNNLNFSIIYKSIPLLCIIGLMALYLGKHYKIRKKINSAKKNILIKSILLMISLVLAYLFVCNKEIIIDKLISIKDQIEIMFITNLSANGYIYINLYSNMLLLIPLTSYLVIRFAKKNNVRNDNYFIILCLIFFIIFMEFLFIGYKYGNVSIYYFSKTYFALWIILLYCNYKALILLSENKKYLPRILISFYIFLMIICTIFSDVKMLDDALENKDENVFSVMEIFGSNKTMLIKEKEKLTQEEIEILMYARKKINYDTRMEIVTEGIQNYWSYVLLRYVNYEPVLNNTNYGQFRLNLKSYYLWNKINNVDYMIYFYRSEKYEELKDRLFINSEIIYQNDAGGILKYNR